MRRHALLPLLTAMVTTACHSHDHPVGVEPEGMCTLTGDFEPPPESVELTMAAYRLPTGAIAEVDVELAEGARVFARFEATGAPVDWNLHTHAEDGAEIVHDAGSGAVDSLEHTVTDADLFSVLLTGRGPVEAQVCLGVFAAGDATLVP